MSTETQNKQKPMHFGLLLLISFVIFHLGLIVDQTIRWSDHLQGLMNGVFHIMFYGIVWCFSLLPWSLLIFILYRRLNWKRFRTHWVLAPAVLALIVVIGSLIINPPTPTNRFKHFAKTELPTKIKNLHYHFSGGGIADYCDTYYFETTPNQVDQLIVAMNLEEDPYYGQEELSYTPVSPLPDCPDFSTWIGAK